MQMNQNDPDDGMKPTIIGHIVIRDNDTGEVLVNQRDTFAQQPPIGEGQKNAVD